MVVVDVGGEELDVTSGGVVAAGIGNQRRHYIGAGRSGELGWGGRLDDGREKVVVGRGHGALLYHGSC